MGGRFLNHSPFDISFVTRYVQYWVGPGIGSLIAVAFYSILKQ